MKQERQQAEKRPTPREEEAEPAPTPAKDIDKAALKQELDDLLDEIDGVLEENASEFVANYVQKGGQ